jgi:hypothetical protein
VAADDPQRRRQAEPAAGELGGEEGIEDLAEGLGVHAAAAVDDLQIDVTAGFETVVHVGRGEVVATGVHLPGDQLDGTDLIVDRLRSVGDDVHHHLADLRRIAFDGAQAGSEIELQRRLLADRRAQQLRHLLDQGREVDGLDQDLALARVRQHLVGELGGPQGRDLDLADELVDRRPARQLHQSQAGVAENSDQQVVEIVRDAAGEEPQALHLLRLLDAPLEPAALLFAALALGDVGDHREAADETAVGVLQRSRRHHGVDLAAVPGGPGHLVGRRQAMTPALLLLLEPAAVVGVAEVSEIAPVQLLPGMAEHLDELGVDQVDAVVAVGGDKALVHAFDQQPVALLAAAQRFVGSAALGDVLLDRHQVGQLTVGVEHRADVMEDQVLGAVLAAVDELLVHRPSPVQLADHPLSLDVVGGAGHQYLHPLAGELLGGVAAHLAEVVVDEQQLGAGQLDVAVGDRHALAHGFERRRQQQPPALGGGQHLGFLAPALRRLLFELGDAPAQTFDLAQEIRVSGRSGAIRWGDQVFSAAIAASRSS